MSEADIKHVVATLPPGQCPSPSNIPTAVVAPAGTVSGAVDFRDYSQGTLIVPAGLSSTSLNFQVSADGTNYVTLCSSGSTPVALTVTSSSEAYPLPSQLAGAAYFKIVCGTAESGGATFNLTLKS